MRMSDWSSDVCSADLEANDEATVVPASLTKLLTAAAALEGLGADARLRTEVRAAAPPVDGVVAGDLWLVGGGDPVLGTDVWASQMDSSPPPHTSLDVLADRVVAAGVRRVEGRVVGDESCYDAERYVDTWPARSDEHTSELQSIMRVSYDVFC